MATEPEVHREDCLFQKTVTHLQSQKMYTDEELQRGSGAGVVGEDFTGCLPSSFS